MAHFWPFKLSYRTIHRCRLVIVFRAEIKILLLFGLAEFEPSVIQHAHVSIRNQDVTEAFCYVYTSSSDFVLSNHVGILTKVTLCGCFHMRWYRYFCHCILCAASKLFLYIELRLYNYMYSRQRWKWDGNDDVEPAI